MNITFLIGNGFDIGLGLKTSFRDFYNVYCKIESNDISIKEFRNKIWTNVYDWSDFEKSFGKYAEHFTSSNSNEYVNQLIDFSINFDKYLIEQEKSFNFENKNLLSMMEKAITSYYLIRHDDSMAIQYLLAASKNEEKHYNFISFNYTYCLDKCVNLLKPKNTNTGDKIDNVIHVHGYSNRDIIMGVNDPSQIINPNFADDPRISNKIIKPYINRLIKRGYDTDATKVISSSSLICIYGMSLGDTDKKWWQLIANWLKESGNRHLIILKYHPVEITCNPIWIDSAESVRERFMSFSNYSEKERESISERIHIDLNHNIFEMKITLQTDQNGMATLTIK